MVLVSILGDFHSSILPLFFEFKEKLTHHVLIHDDSKYDIKQYEKLENAQEYFQEHYENPETFKGVKFEIVSLKIKEDDYSDILKAYERISSLASSKDEIYLNTTDGLSSIAIVLSNKLLQEGGNVLSYDRYANTYNLHTKDSMDKHNIKHNIDIKNHLKLKGYSLLDFSNIFTLQKRKDAIFEFSKDLVEFKKFARAYPNELTPEMNNYVKTVDAIGIADKEKKYFLAGTVFEEYIFWLIKDNLDFDEVMTGVSIEFEKDFKNEIDILMIKDNHLHSIECKFVYKLDGEHFVYKTDSIIDYLDNDGKAMILSIGNDQKTYNPRKNKYSHQFTLGDKGRALYSNIKIHHFKEFDEERFLNDVSLFFNVPRKVEVS